MSRPNQSQDGSLISHDVKVYGFNIGDVEDPDLYAASPLIDFERSEKGKWLKKHATDLYWRRMIARYDMGYDYEIRAVLYEADYLIYKLKYE